eukprot:2258732-Rhodomonas_salina.1
MASTTGLFRSKAELDMLAVARFQDPNATWDELGTFKIGTNLGQVLDMLRGRKTFPPNIDSVYGVRASASGKTLNSLKSIYAH